MPLLKIAMLRPFMRFSDKEGVLTKEAYDFLFGLFQRVGGTLSDLNAAMLQDKTWDAPNPIGSTTPSTGNFTSLSSIALDADSLKINPAKLNTVALVSGVATVSTTAITSTSRVFLTSQTDGGTPGWLRVSAITAGTSFTIRSSSTTDTSTVAWFIVEQG